MVGSEKKKIVILWTPNSDWTRYSLKTDTLFKTIYNQSELDILPAGLFTDGTDFKKCFVRKTFNEQ